MEQTNQTTEQQIEQIEQVENAPTVQEHPAPVLVEKKTFLQKYPNTWKFVTTGVLSFFAGMIALSLITCITQKEKGPMRNFEYSESPRQQKQQGNRIPSTSTQPSAPSQSTEQAPAQQNQTI